MADHAEALEIADTASKRSTRRRRSRRFVVGLIAVACLAAIAVGAYLYFTESVVIEKARRQIANGEYEDASRTLTDLPHRWFVEREATYLKAKADLKKYASAKEIDDDEHVLQKVDERLKSLFNASEAWRANEPRGTWRMRWPKCLGMPRMLSHAGSSIAQSSRGIASG